MNDSTIDKLAPIELSIDGDFSFTLNKLFQTVLERYARGERAFIVDLSNVDELDTSALGMLLQLRDHSRGGGAVTLVNPSDAVRAALSEAPIGGLFPIVER